MLLQVCSTPSGVSHRLLFVGDSWARLLCRFLFLMEEIRGSCQVSWWLVSFSALYIPVHLLTSLHVLLHNRHCVWSYLLLFSLVPPNYRQLAGFLVSCLYLQWARPVRSPFLISLHSALPPPPVSSAYLPPVWIWTGERGLLHSPSTRASAEASQRSGQKVIRGGRNPILSSACLTAVHSQPLPPTLYF